MEQSLKWVTNAEAHIFWPRGWTHLQQDVADALRHEVAGSRAHADDGGAVVGEVELLRQKLWDMPQLQHGGQLLQTDVQRRAQLVQVNGCAICRPQQVASLHVLCLMHAEHLGDEAVSAERSTHMKLPTMWLWT